MSAAKIAFTFLKRGLNHCLCLSQYAALAWLAMSGESDRASILKAIGHSVSTRNSESVVVKLVKMGLVSQRLKTEKGVRGRGKFVHAITDKGLKILSLKQEVDV